MPNSSYSLGDRERKILKDYELIGSVVALRNIQSGVEEKSTGVCLCFIFSLHERDPKIIFF